MEQKGYKSYRWQLTSKWKDAGAILTMFNNCMRGEYGMDDETPGAFIERIAKSTLR